jgi:hypothetical protein
VVVSVEVSPADLNAFLVQAVSEGGGMIIGRCARP